jgi:tRNA nucleotidyltransferase (CCA-adding enzyme)
MTAPEALLSLLEERLEPPQRQALDLLKRLASDSGAALYLVGGAVRDLLLGRGHIDLDIAVEGDAAPLARDLAAALGGRAVLHPRFGTAVVRAPGVSADLARTRREKYARPGALPDVEPAPLEEDLGRRDFTFNAMALRLTRPVGSLMDPFGGQRDLAEGLVRVLHPRSFQDDATRILRAVRYAARLSFRIEEETLYVLRRDLSYLDTVSGARLRRELELLLREEAAPSAAALAQELGVLGALHPLLAADQAVLAAWAEALAGAHLAPVEEMGLCLIQRCASGEEVRALSDRLHLTGRLERAISDFVRLGRLFAKLDAPPAPAEAVRLLKGLSAGAVWARAVAGSEPGRETCRRYLLEWRRVRPILRGDDVIALGVAPGAEVGRALTRLRIERLEGRLRSREEEEAFVRRLAGEAQHAGNGD